MDSLNYKYVFAFRQSPENNQCWRQRIAWFFRRLADRIDRRESYALRFVSDPVVSQNYRNRCVERGMTLALDLMIESLKYESMDQHLKASLPHLWEPETEKNSPKP